ncbi:sensor histidine kinase [Euzebya rosea]|uniref:sensor histidine kinase n=1 Tax=Euzebya rosea TaxID=2052804 RepID=UPI000D3E6D8E|nr:ATP-binding protein [Euzebya rosea]
MTGRDDEIARLRRVVERERQARREAEQIAERAIARLYRTLEATEQEHATLRAVAASATHDIKNPLSTISGFAKLLDARQIEEPLLTEILGRLVASTDYTIELIDGLLEVLAAGTVAGRTATTDLDPVIEQVASELRARHPEARLVGEPVGKVAMAAVDAHRLLDNLAENAARHAGVPSVRITVEVLQRNPEEVTLRVGDNGVGIDEADRDRVFTIFQRGLDKARGTGTGVGLALCRRLVEAVGGALWLDESPSPEGGAAFLLRLPVPAEDTG